MSDDIGREDKPLSIENLDAAFAQLGRHEFLYIDRLIQGSAASEPCETLGHCYHETTAVGVFRCCRCGNTRGPDDRD